MPRTVAGMNDEQLAAYIEGLIRWAKYYDEMTNYHPPFPQKDDYREAAFENRKKARELKGKLE